MNAEVFNVAFGAFLSAGLDYATCDKKAHDLVNLVASKNVAPQAAPVAELAAERATAESAQDAAQGPRETQTDFVLRVCNGQWRTRAWIAERIDSESKIESATRTCNKLVQNGHLKRTGSRTNPSFLRASVVAAQPTASIQAELPVIQRDASTDADLYQRESESQPEFLMRVCSGQWRSLVWLAARIATNSPYPKAPTSAACNKLIHAGRLESKGQRGTVCYRVKVTP